MKKCVQQGYHFENFIRNAWNQFHSIVLLEQVNKTQKIIVKLLLSSENELFKVEETSQIWIISRIMGTPWVHLGTLGYGRVDEILGFFAFCNKVDTAYTK